MWTTSSLNFVLALYVGLGTVPFLGSALAVVGSTMRRSMKSRSVLPTWRTLIVTLFATFPAVRATCGYAWQMPYHLDSSCYAGYSITGSHCIGRADLLVYQGSSCGPWYQCCHGTQIWCDVEHEAQTTCTSHTQTGGSPVPSFLMGCAECPDATHWSFLARDQANDIDAGRTDQGFITEGACVLRCEEAHDQNAQFGANCDAWLLTDESPPRCYTYDLRASGEKMFTASCTSSDAVTDHKWRGQVRSRTLFGEPGESGAANHRVGYFADEGACTLSPVVQWDADAPAAGSRFDVSNWGLTATLAPYSYYGAADSYYGTAVAHATLGKTSGKWYQEVKVTGITHRTDYPTGLYVGIGIAHGSGVVSPGYSPSDTSGLLLYYDDWDPNYVFPVNYDASASNPILIAQPRGTGALKVGDFYFPTYAVSKAAWSVDDVIGVALDADAGTMRFYHNGVDQGEVDSALTSVYPSGGMSSELSSGEEWHLALGDAISYGTNGGVFKLLPADEAEYPTPSGYSYWSSTTPTYAPTAVGRSCSDWAASWGKHLITYFTAQTGYDLYHDCQAKCDALGPSKCDGYQVIHSGTNAGECAIWSESLSSADAWGEWTYNAGAGGGAVCRYKTQADYACTLRYSIRKCAPTYLYTYQGCVQYQYQDIIKYTNKTVDECKNLCSDHGGDHGGTPNCLGFEYGVDYGGGTSPLYGVDYGAPGDCRLKQSADTWGCNGADRNLDFYTKVSAPLAPLPPPSPPPPPPPPPPLSNPPPASYQADARFKVKGNDRCLDFASGSFNCCGDGDQTDNLYWGVCHTGDNQMCAASPSHRSRFPARGDLCCVGAQVLL